MPNPNMKMVYMIEGDSQGGKGFWTKVGVAYVNRDGSLNVKLSAVPAPTPIWNKDGELVRMSYQLHIRDQSERTEGGGRGGARRPQRDQGYSEPEDAGDGDDTVPWE